MHFRKAFGYSLIENSLSSWEMLRVAIVRALGVKTSQPSPNLLRNRLLRTSLTRIGFRLFAHHRCKSSSPLQARSTKQHFSFFFCSKRYVSALHTHFVGSDWIAEKGFESVLGPLAHARTRTSVRERRV